MLGLKLRKYFCELQYTKWKKKNTLEVKVLVLL